MGQATTVASAFTAIILITGIAIMITTNTTFTINIAVPGSMVHFYWIVTP